MKNRIEESKVRTSGSGAMLPENNVQSDSRPERGTSWTVWVERTMQRFGRME